MLHAIGIYDWTNYTRNKALAEKFAYTINSMDRPCLFIFDEAGLFSQDMLKYFHTIFDSTKGKLGIVLAGTPVLKENIKRWMIKNSGIAELDSRILYWAEIYSCKRTERQEVALKNGITDPDLAKEISNSTQSFRGVYNKVMHHRIQVKRDRDPIKNKPSREHSKLQKPKML